MAGVASIRLLKSAWPVYDAAMIGRKSRQWKLRPTTKRDGHHLGVPCYDAATSRTAALLAGGRPAFRAAIRHGAEVGRKSERRTQSAEGRKCGCVRHQAAFCSRLAPGHPIKPPLAGLAGRGPRKTALAGVRRGHSEGGAACGVPLESCGVPLGSCGVPLGSCGVPLESCGVPSGSCGVPSESCGVPSESRGVPAESRGVPLESEGVPLAALGARRRSGGREAGDAGWFLTVSRCRFLPCLELGAWDLSFRRREKKF